MHPVNSEDFGANGMQIVYSTDGSTTVTGHIVEQIGLTKYIVAPGAIGTAHKATYVQVVLATTPAQVAALPAGYGTIVVTPAVTGGTQHARKIFGRKLLTVEGHTFNWRKTTAVHKGECNVAGNWDLGPDAAGFVDKVNV